MMYSVLLTVIIYSTFAQNGNPTTSSPATGALTATSCQPDSTNIGAGCETFMESVRHYITSIDAMEIPVCVPVPNYPDYGTCSVSCKVSTDHCAPLGVEINGVESQCIQGSNSFGGWPFCAQQTQGTNTPAPSTPYPVHAPSTPLVDPCDVLPRACNPGDRTSWLYGTTCGIEYLQGTYCYVYRCLYCDMAAVNTLCSSVGGITQTCGGVSYSHTFTSGETLDCGECIDTTPQAVQTPDPTPPPVTSAPSTPAPVTHSPTARPHTYPPASVTSPTDAWLGTPPTEGPHTSTVTQPTEAPPTNAPPTEVPPTHAPPTSTVTQPTEAPPTHAPPTEASPTSTVTQPTEARPHTYPPATVTSPAAVPHAYPTATPAPATPSPTTTVSPTSSVNSGGLPVPSPTARPHTYPPASSPTDAWLGTSPTAAPPTEAPPTEAPPTSTVTQPTEAPPTHAQPTEASPTSTVTQPNASPTHAPPTEAPPTARPVPSPTARPHTYPPASSPTDAWLGTPPTDAPPIEGPPTSTVTQPTEAQPTHAPPTEAPPTEASTGPIPPPTEASTGPTAKPDAWLGSSPYPAPTARPHAYPVSAPVPSPTTNPANSVAYTGGSVGAITPTTTTLSCGNQPAVSMKEPCEVDPGDGCVLLFDIATEVCVITGKMTKEYLQDTVTQAMENIVEELEGNDVVCVQDSMIVNFKALVVTDIGEQDVQGNVVTSASNNCPDVVEQCGPDEKPRFEVKVEFALRCGEDPSPSCIDLKKLALKFKEADRTSLSRAFEAEWEEMSETFDEFCHVGLGRVSIVNAIEVSLMRNGKLILNEADIFLNNGALSRAYLVSVIFVYVVLFLIH